MGRAKKVCPFVCVCVCVCVSSCLRPRSSRSFQIQSPRKGKEQQGLTKAWNTPQSRQEEGGPLFQKNTVAMKTASGMDGARENEGQEEGQQMDVLILESPELMKGEASDVVTEARRSGGGNDLDKLPLLSPPEISQVEEGVSDGEGSEIEKGCGACCRICLELESLAPGDELIAPCMCKGTQQLVHRSCLDHWRSVKEGFSFSHCTTCKAQFHLRPELPEDHSWRKIKFKLFVARDVFLVFLAVQTAISVLGGITYLLYNGQLRGPFNGSWNEIFKKHPIPFYYCVGVFLFFLILGVAGMVIHCLSMGHNDGCADGCRDACYAWGCFPASIEACGVFLIIFVILFAILGVVYGLLAATMAIQRIWQQHYHILTKRVLTKEYIVEDLHGNYKPPTLAAEHVNRLRSLHLF